MLGIPGAGRLVEAPQPKHRLGNEFVPELQPLEVAFVRRDVEFAEHAEFVLCEAEDEIGISSWIDPDTGQPAEESIPRTEDN